MTLDEEFPNAAVDFQTDDGFLKSPITYDCAGCGKDTAWYHWSLSVHLCSRKCYESYRCDMSRQAQTKRGRDP